MSLKYEPASKRTSISSGRHPSRQDYISDYSNKRKSVRKVDVRLPEGNSNSYGARPVRLIITSLRFTRVDCHRLFSRWCSGCRGANPSTLGFSNRALPTLRLRKRTSDFKGIILSLATDIYFLGKACDPYPQPWVSDSLLLLDCSHVWRCVI